MGTLLSIGAFARAAGLPPSALRYYDEIGLLPAALTDPSNSYRYYDESQQAQAMLIAALRALDVSVDDMRDVLNASEQERSIRLEHLAQEALRQGEARAAGLRALIRRETHSGPAFLRVNGPSCADAFRRVARIAGEDPFDGVLVVSSPAGLRLLATDRFRLADFRVSGTGRGVLVRLLRARHVAAVASLLETTAGQVGIRLDEALVVDGASFPLETPSGFPALASLADSFEGGVGQPTPVADSWTDASTESVDLTVAGEQVRVTTTLMTGTAHVLGGSIQVAAGTRQKPIVLSCPEHEDRRVILMPRGGGGGAESSHGA